MTLLRKAFAGDARDVWLARLREAGVPAGAVRTISEALNSEEVVGRRMVVEVDHPTAGRLRVPGSPLKLANNPPPDPTPPPLLGQHTARVLRDVLGKTETEIETLRTLGAVGAATAQ